jgi:hypothetical protein
MNVMALYFTQDLFAAYAARFVLIDILLPSAAE